MTSSLISATSSEPWVIKVRLVSDWLTPMQYPGVETPSEGNVTQVTDTLLFRMVLSFLLTLTPHEMMSPVTWRQ
ncbi:hypothetical protein BaRGS_00014406, partial [Batillaria attramentaria]